MIEILAPILGSVMQLAILAGIVVFIVRRAKRGSATRESAGILIRRFFQYTAMLGVLVLVGIGLAGLIDAAMATAAQVTQDSAAVARSIAFVVVGLPIGSGLAIYTARRLRGDPREQGSLGWAVYLTIALVGSLVAAMSLLIAFLHELVDQQEIDRTLLINAVIWVGSWTGHWWVGQGRGVAQRMQIHLLLGSAAGLVALVFGAGAGLTAAMQQIYDRVFAFSMIDAGIEAILRPLIIFLVGITVWWWYWHRRALHSDRNTWWAAYVLLLGVLGGVITWVTGAGFALFGVLQWFLGHPMSTSAAAHFDLLPGALGAIAVGGAAWAYHHVVLGGRARPERTELDRVHDYLLSGAGLLVAAGGLGTLATVAFDAVGGREIAASTSGNAIAAAITMLVIGTPLWWRYWATTRRRCETNLPEELRSITRRIYLLLLFGATGIVAVINLVILVFILVENMLDETLGSATISSVALPASLLLTAGALAWYHFAVFREDRAAISEEEQPALREVVLVCADGEQLAQAISARTGATVHRVRVAAGTTATGTIDDLLEALRSEKHQRVVVAGTDDSYDVIPIED